MNGDGSTLADTQSSVLSANITSAAGVVGIIELPTGANFTALQRVCRSRVGLYTAEAVCRTFGLFDSNKTIAYAVDAASVPALQPAAAAGLSTVSQSGFVCPTATSPLLQCNINRVVTPGSCPGALGFACLNWSDPILVPSDPRPMQ